MGFWQRRLTTNRNEEDRPVDIHSYFFDSYHRNTSKRQRPKNPQIQLQSAPNFSVTDESPSP